MRRLLLALFAFLAALPAAAHQARPEAPEVLVVLQTEHGAALAPGLPQGMKIYHRLPEGLLIGIPRHALDRTPPPGIRWEVVDPHPWGRPYAVVTGRHPREAALAGLCAPVQVLRVWHDHVLVSGTPEDFEALRARGYVVSEVLREEIPAPGVELQLPPGMGVTADSAIAAVIARVSDSTITAWIQALQNFGTRYWNNANRDSVARSIRNVFLATGITDVQLDSFQYNGTWQKNVVASIPGAGEIIADMIVGGHHDSYSSNLLDAPGADDNATGTVAAMEMARVLKEVGYTPNLTLRFMGFGAEEAGLRGSASYASRARQAGRDIRAMLNYDMIGNRTQSQPDRDFYMVWYTGARALADLHAAIATAYTTLTPVFTTNYRSGSDSYSFYQQGYPADFCIERDFSPYYHGPNDRLQYLDIPYARDIIKAGLATLLTLDRMPPPVAGLRVRDRGNGSSAFLSWDSVTVPDWAGYRIYAGVLPGVYDTTFVVTGRSCTLGGLTPGTTYYAGVAILDYVGQTGFIAEQAVTPRVVPLPPAGVWAEGIPQGVRLWWMRNGEVDLRGYYVYRSSVPPAGFTRVTPEPLTDSTWTDAGLPAGIYSYYVSAVDSNMNESAASDTVEGSPITGVDPRAGVPPRSFRLFQNYPNPFNPSTEIGFEIPEAAPVMLTVHDVLGRTVATLVNGRLEVGRHSVRWHAGPSASGIYMALLRTGARTATLRMMLMK
ncbi:MAG: M20/M25/M40 family metallo-hydrolase [Bacteroidota bacterium]